ncbi:MAG: hypothetical protein A4E70_00470 [Syntrophus sp. PtaU1.Bin005]|jgi:hypothetical protein|nr:MAG: hypothetical protein A4E70_00470 [Syntrophus sp. PtaU1.Bin005]
MDISNIDVQRILKWVLIVLITGFIAQFGKSFAKYLLEKIRARKALEAEKLTSAAGGQEPPKPALPPERVSMAQKEPEVATFADAVPPSETDEAKLRKKALKAQVKEQKKKKKEDV